MRVRSWTPMWNTHWFAWYPVKCEYHWHNGQKLHTPVWVWLEWILRKKVFVANGKFVYEYLI